MYTIGWSHGQEEFRPGVPDTRKASFYFDPYVAERNVFPTKHSSSSLLDMEALVMEMTHFMTQVGLWIAQLCDVYLQHKHNNKAIYESLKSCDQTKARLLYYFPPTESTTTTSTSSSSSFDDWCGWHKDHGSLTALLPGLLDDDDDDGQNSTECATNSNTIIGDSTTTKPGLYIQTTTTNNDRQDDPVHVPLPPTSLGFQLGETLEIMSRGRLRATPHAVRGGTVGSGGRSSLAVFLQPQASQSLPPLVSSSHDESLQARWRPTFGTFQKATTQAFQSTTAQN
jgi:isopenicillin N synthase-like dioxygenase